jgi:hypothetical protein
MVVMKRAIPITRRCPDQIQKVQGDNSNRIGHECPQTLLRFIQTIGHKKIL